MPFILQSRNSHFIQNIKHILNEYTKECYDDVLQGEDCYNYNYDPNIDEQLLLLLVQDSNGLITVKHNKYNIVSFLLIKCDLITKICSVWNVCTPIQFRRQNYFTKTMKYFLKTFTSKWKEIILYVNPKIESYLYLTQMYSKFGFKIIDWTNTYCMKLLNYPYSSNEKVKTIIPFDLNNFYKLLFQIYKKYNEFHFIIDENYNLTIIPQEIIFKPNLKKFSDSFNDFNLNFNKFLYFYPNNPQHLNKCRSLRYFYNMKDFLTRVHKTYFQNFFEYILKCAQSKSFHQIYSHTLNPNLLDLTPRFFICIELKN